jgi:hypothetical protein
LFTGTFSLATAAPHLLTPLLHTLFLAVRFFLAASPVMTRHNPKCNDNPSLTSQMVAD